MEDTLIGYEVAKLAKEKGFNINTDLGYYKHGTDEDFVPLLLWSEAEGNDPDFGFAPTQSLLQKWLREEKDMWVTPLFDSITYSVSIYGRYTPTDEEIVISPTDGPESWFITYEEALEAGITEALKLIK